MECRSPVVYDARDGIWVLRRWMAVRRVSMTAVTTRYLRLASTKRSEFLISGGSSGRDISCLRQQPPCQRCWRHVGGCWRRPSLKTLCFRRRLLRMLADVGDANIGPARLTADVGGMLASVTGHLPGTEMHSWFPLFVPSRPGEGRRGACHRAGPRFGRSFRPRSSGPRPSG